MKANSHLVPDRDGSREKIPSPLKELYQKAVDGSKEDLKKHLQDHPDLPLNSKDRQGSTLLHKIAETGRSDSAAALLEGGPKTRSKINAVDNFGETPLHKAAMAGHKGMVEVLTTAEGVNIEARDKKGSTPLHVAAMHGNEEAVKTLLEKGADLKAKNSEGKSAFDVAKPSSEARIVLQRENIKMDTKKDAENVKAGHMRELEASAVADWSAVKSAPKDVSTKSVTPPTISKEDSARRSSVSEAKSHTDRLVNKEKVDFPPVPARGKDSGRE